MIDQRLPREKNPFLPWASYLLFIPLMIMVTVGCGTLSLICSLWDRSGRQQHAIAQFWAKLMLGIALSPVRVVNPQHLHLRVGRSSPATISATWIRPRCSAACPFSSASSRIIIFSITRLWAGT